MIQKLYILIKQSQGTVYWSVYFNNEFNRRHFKTEYNISYIYIYISTCVCVCGNGFPITSTHENKTTAPVHIEGTQKATHIQVYVYVISCFCYAGVCVWARSYFEHPGAAATAFGRTYGPSRCRDTTQAGTQTIYKEAKVRRATGVWFIDEMSHMRSLNKTMLRRQCGRNVISYDEMKHNLLCIN